ncbi:hypothetical protein GCM10009682_00440 [Luedemannella flava]|uniref:Metallothionein n=1 Tax=Luedemannella flava TaxID=349316 RepID=A0ABP4XGI0_9ACTN
MINKTSSTQSGDPAKVISPPSTQGCCGSATADGAAPVAQESTCCGTTAEAVASGGCCGAAAKAEAVASGAGCCR